MPCLHRLRVPRRPLSPPLRPPRQWQLLLPRRPPPLHPIPPPIHPFRCSQGIRCLLPHLRSLPSRSPPTHCHCCDGASQSPQVRQRSGHCPLVCLRLPPQQCLEGPRNRTLQQREGRQLPPVLLPCTSLPPAGRQHLDCCHHERGKHSLKRMAGSRYSRGRLQCRRHRQRLCRFAYRSLTAAPARLQYPHLHQPRQPVWPGRGGQCTRRCGRTSGTAESILKQRSSGGHLRGKETNDPPLPEVGALW